MGWFHSAARFTDLSPYLPWLLVGGPCVAGHRRRLDGRSAMNRSIDASMKRFSEKQWLVILLALLQFIILSDYLVLMPMGPMLMDTFRLDTRQFAGLVSIYSIGAIIIAFTTAGVLDRFDRFRSLQLVFLCFLVISALHLLVNDYRVLLLLRFFAGGAAGLIGSLIMSVISQKFVSNRRGRVIGIVLSATSICQIVGIPAGLFLVTRYGWKAPFLLNALLGLVVCLFLLRIQPERNPVRRERPVGNQMLRIAREPFHLQAMVCTLLTMLAGNLIVPFLPLLLVFRHGVPENEMGGIYLIAGLVAFGGSLLAGKVSERGNGRFAIYLVSSLGMIPLLVFAFAGAMPGWGVVGVFAICNALLITRMIPTNRFVMEFIHPDLLGGFQSINTALMHIGASSAAWIGGFLISVEDGKMLGFEHAVFASISATCLVFVIVFVGFRSRPESSGQGSGL